MKLCDDTYGQALALENIAKTYEYMANLTKACETLEQVSNQWMDPSCHCSSILCRGQGVGGGVALVVG